MLVSEVQTKGRGRAGKSWQSPKGGLWFSVILRPRISASKIGVVQFLAANATAHAVRTITGERISLKWPNDLVLQSRKLGGILVETKIVDEEVSFAVLGIGINVNQDQRLLPEGAISLYTATGRRHSLGRLLKSIVEAIDSKYDALGDPERITKEWWKNCLHRSKMVRIEGIDKTMVGRSIGVDDQAQLLVETDERIIEKVSEGTLRVLNS